ncbi:unnamed protein product [Gadus morhua 'NCC']
MELRGQEGRALFGECPRSTAPSPRSYLCPPFLQQVPPFWIDNCHGQTPPSWPPQGRSPHQPQWSSVQGVDEQAPA